MWTSSSSSSSSCWTSLSSSTSDLRLPKTREEVWNGISDLQQQGVILQDFFSKDPPPTAAPTTLALNPAPLPFQQILPAAAFDGRSSGERRRKRMIKNRESAARSRARKQAYTTELELEVAHLLKENAKLRKQQQASNTEAAADNKKMKSLHRTFTAPF